MQPISTKRLRQDLPAVKEELLAGKSFYWIDRSKPIGLIQPLPEKNKELTPKKQKEEHKKLVGKLAGGIKLKSYPTPTELNRIIDQEYEEMLPR